jgi:hypothetical protein
MTVVPQMLHRQFDVPVHRQPWYHDHPWGGGLIPAQVSITASPRRMVPPLTTEA